MSSNVVNHSNDSSSSLWIHRVRDVPKHWALRRFDSTLHLHRYSVIATSFPLSALA